LRYGQCRARVAYRTYRNQFFCDDAAKISIIIEKTIKTEQKSHFYFIHLFFFFIFTSHQKRYAKSVTPKASANGILTVCSDEK
jgi:hypothetical protein